MTLSEALLWNAIKQRQIMGYDFDRQRPIDDYIVDFYCKDLCLAIEIDGATHEHPDVIVADQLRQKRLESLGVRFLRFDDIEVKTNINCVIDEIRFWIEKKG